LPCLAAGIAETTPAGVPSLPPPALEQCGTVCHGDWRIRKRLLFYEDLSNSRAQAMRGCLVSLHGPTSPKTHCGARSRF
jgi:hypothetical protein